MSKKTNAMRLLEAKNIDYVALEYDVSDGQIDGVSVAQKVKRSPEMVFKTLVVVGASKNYYVVVVPVETSVNLKSVAKHFKEKKIEMIPVKDIMKVTGYIRGGCSPLGMKKTYKTVVDETIEILDEIVFSGGRQGLQIEMNGDDLLKVLDYDIGVVTD